MLQLGSTTKVIDGVTVFADHADPNRFWYLPAPVTLGDKPDGSKAFTFIKYQDGARAGGARGGGFLMFETVLTLDPGTERRILSALRQEAAEPTLEMVPFDEGTVECVALNLQGGGGTHAVEAGPGGFVAVEDILGTSVPSLFGDNRALFSLTLSAEGATILEQALAQQAAPIGVIYKLTFTALRPSLHVRIKADLERVYNGLAAGLGANVGWFSANIEAAFEKLAQDGVIDIKVLTFSTAADLKDKEMWALDFFRDQLLRDWFVPSLSPQTVPQLPAGPTLPGGTVSGGAGPHTGGSTGGTTAGAGNPIGGAIGGAVAGAIGGALGGPSGGATGGPAGSTGGLPRPPTTGAGTTGAGTPGGGTVPPRPPTPAGGGTGGSVEKAASPRPGEVSARLADGPRCAPEDPNPATRHWMRGRARHGGAVAGSGAGVPEGGAGVGRAVPAESPGQRRVTARLARTPGQPLGEGAGEGAGGPVPGGGEGSAPGGGATASGGTPAAPGGTTPGVPGGGSTPPAPGTGSGPPRAPGATTGTTPPGPPGVSTGSGAAGGTTSPGAPRSGVPAGGGEGAPAGRPAAPPGPGAGATSGSTPAAPAAGLTAGQGGGLVSFRLRFVHQEERKKLDVTYDRADAVQRVYAPQGYFNLLAGDLDDPRYFVQVDLDDPFFRAFDIDVRCRTDYAAIGLTSVNVALSYGRDSDPGGPKTADFIFDPTTPTEQRFTPSVNAALDTTFHYRIEYNFAGGTEWRGQDTTYVVEGDTEDRTLEVDPYRHLGFLDVRIRPGDMDARVLSASDVHLRYEGPDGWVRTDVVPLTPGGPEQRWRVRSRDREARRFGYTVVHTLADGSTVTTEPVETEASSVLVGDPFPGLLTVDLVPVWDPATVRTVFVDLSYADEPNAYRRDERYEIPGTQTSSVRVPIALRDPERRAYDLRLTFIGTDNSTRQVSFSGRTDTLVEMRPT